MINLCCDFPFKDGEGQCHAPCYNVTMFLNVIEWEGHSHAPFQVCKLSRTSA